MPAPAADPQVLAVMSEQCEELLRELDDEALRQIALLKMEGYANEEIARKLDCSVRTVKRRLAMIRSRWVEKAGIL